MKHKVDVIRYRGKKVKVYIDDYGQCYYFIYKGNEYPCGAYNIDYLGEIVGVIDADLNEEIDVSAIEPHSPSAKVYKQFGVWYMDYFGYDKLLISYGDLLKKKDRPSRGKLIKLAKAEMRSIIDSLKCSKNEKGK